MLVAPNQMAGHQQARRASSRTGNHPNIRDDFDCISQMPDRKRTEVSELHVDYPCPSLSNLLASRHTLRLHKDSALRCPWPLPLVPVGVARSLHRARQTPEIPVGPTASLVVRRPSLPPAPPYSCC